MRNIIWITTRANSFIFVDKVLKTKAFPSTKVLTITSRVPFATLTLGNIKLILASRNPYHVKSKVVISYYYGDLKYNKFVESRRNKIIQYKLTPTTMSKIPF